MIKLLVKRQQSISLVNIKISHKNLYILLCEVCHLWFEIEKKTPSKKKKRSNKYFRISVSFYFSVYMKQNVSDFLYLSFFESYQGYLLFLFPDMSSFCLISGLLTNKMTGCTSAVLMVFKSHPYRYVLRYQKFIIKGREDVLKSLLGW